MICTLYTYINWPSVIGQTRARRADGPCFDI